MTAILTLLQLIFFVSAVFGASTKEWSEKNLGESGSGTYEGMMFSEQGRMAPGIRTEKKLYREDLSFWSGSFEKSGTIIAGGGTPPFVVRLEKDGTFSSIKLDGILKDGRDSTSSLAVIRVISKERAVIGFSGTGVVGIIKPAKASESAILSRLPVRGVWDLLEGGDGFLYAATGPLGQIFRINLETGQFELWAQLKDTNIRSLCWSKGRLLAGGGDSGNLYEIRGKDRAETVRHFEEQSIQRILEHKDGILVVVNRLRSPADEKSEDSYRKYFKKLSDLPKGFGIDEKMPAPPDQMRSISSNYASGALYLIGRDYRLDQLANLNGEHILDAMIDSDGRIYLATGPRGRVYMVRAKAGEERELWTVQEFEYVNATSILMREGFPRAFLASGHEAVVFMRADKQGRIGTFKSKEFSPGRPARWGALSWRGSGVRVYTRNGHSPKPDSTWTAWVERKNGVSTSSNSKAYSFAQIRIDLLGKAELYGFAWRYAEKNQRPVINKLVVGERELAKDGAQRLITWEGTDPNSDRLEYRIAVKEESSPQWQELSGPLPLSDMKFILPVGKLPDGRYMLRVTASDSPSNYESPLAVSKVSHSFIVNNGRPEIKEMQFNPATATLTAHISDRLSIITWLSISIDGGEWRSIAPTDGILDEKEEDLRIAVPAMRTGRHSISLKAVDEAGNESVRQISVSLDKPALQPQPTDSPVIDEEQDGKSPEVSENPGQKQQ